MCFTTMKNLGLSATLYILSMIKEKSMVKLIVAEIKYWREFYKIFSTTKQERKEISMACVVGKSRYDAYCAKKREAYPGM